MPVPDTVIWPLEILQVKYIEHEQYIEHEHIFKNYPVSITVYCKNPITNVVSSYRLCPNCLQNVWNCLCFTSSPNGEDIILVTNPNHRWDWDYAGRLLKSNA